MVIKPAGINAFLKLLADFTYSTTFIFRSCVDCSVPVEITKLRNDGTPLGGLANFTHSAK